MAVSSLTRFTVPLGGNQSATTQGLLMPKLKFRFRGTFENFGVSNPKTELTKQILTFARPQVTFDPIEIPIYNSKIYIAGRMQGTSVPTVMGNMAIGTSTATPAVGQTQLTTEAGRVALASFTNGGTAAVTATATFPAGTGTGAITEAGIFNAGSAGTMLCRTTFPVVNKAAGDSIAITWIITVS